MPRLASAACLLGLLLPALAAAQADDEAWFRQVLAAVQERDIEFVQESAAGRRLRELPFEEFSARVATVRGKPLPLLFARVLGGATRPVEAEEGGGVTGYLAAPATDPSWRDWRAYARGEVDSQGSEATTWALALRRDARIAKLGFYLERRTGKRLVELSDADVRPLREGDPEYGALAEDVFEPLTVVLARPDEFPRSGPAHAPIPMLTLLPAAAVPGSEDVHGVAARPGGPLVARRTDSMLVLQDIAGVLSIDDRIRHDTIGDVLVHELFHGIHGDLTAGHPLARPSKSKVGHDAHIVSDRYLAFAEGWAEMSEAWSGEANPVFDNSAGDSPALPFLLGRQRPIRHNRYVQERFQKFVVTDSARRRARIKNGAQMVASEGVVASVLYQLVTHDKVPEALHLAFRCLYEENPDTLPALVAGMAARASDERTRRSILLTYLHATRFATASVEARQAYQRADAAGLAFLAAKNQGTDAARIEAAAAAARAAEAAYEELADALAERVLAGELPLDAAVGPELWFEGLREDGGKPFRFDVNTVLPHQLLDIGFSEVGALALVEARDRTGALVDIRALAEVLPAEDFGPLRELRQAHHDGQLDGLQALEAMMETRRMERRHRDLRAD